LLGQYWSGYKTASTPSEIISNRVCGIWFGIAEGANCVFKSSTLSYNSLNIYLHETTREILVAKTKTKNISFSIFKTKSC